MPRGLAAIVFAYAGLSLAQWGNAARWLHASPGVLRCGNVVSDPYLVLVNFVTPIAAACAASLFWWCIRARRWSAASAATLVAFLATSAGLAFEGVLLQRDYGFDILCGVWWLGGMPAKP